MPDNPVAGKAGNLTRANHMLHFLSRRTDDYSVDFLSINDWGEWDELNKKKFADEHPNVKLTLFNRKGSKNNQIKGFFEYKLPNVLPKIIKGNSIDITNPILGNKVRNFINKGKYDIIIISYASWGSIIDGIDKSHKPYLICDTHDFITAQSRNKQNKIGRLFQTEIKILQQFDEIWTYSIEEEYIFEQFTNRKTVLIPVSFPVKFEPLKSSFKYDIIFVGSLNPHNIKGLNWFLNEVLPLLNGVKVHIIGKICTVIGDYLNVVKHGMVDDLHEFYTNAKIAICPMLSGTGVKIKVLEALSYGLPVVTNRRGIDGLINKKNNGCLVSADADEFAENINKLTNDQQFYQQMKTTAEHYFIENHSPEAEEKVLNLIFQIKR